MQSKKSDMPSTTWAVFNNKVLKKIVLGAWHYEKKNITDKKRKIS